MNKDNILKWCETLESGEYQQASGSLYRKEANTNSDGFCCLGVGCKVAEIDIPIISDGSRSVSGLPPSSFANWLEIKPIETTENIVGIGLESIVKTGKIVNIFADGESLSEMNDIKRRDFNYIAARIRLAAGLPPKGL